MNRLEKNSSPLVSVMIPTYRQERSVLRAVESALAQDYPNLEVIVSDDASPDNTAAVVAACNDRRLSYHRHAVNVGRVANYRHTLYQLARGDWVVNLDGDDYFTDPGFISSAMEMACRDRDIVIVAARCLTETPSRRAVSKIPAEAIFRGSDVVLHLPDQAFGFMHLATLYHRATALETDFYSRDVLSSDWDSLYRLALRGKVAYLDRVAGVWRLHGGNESLGAQVGALIENLKIWPGIYDEAVRVGAPAAAAGKALKRMLFGLSYFYFSSLMEAGKGWDAARFLLALRRVDIFLPARLASNYKVVAKLMLFVAGCSGLSMAPATKGDT